MNEKPKASVILDTKNTFLELANRHLDVVYVEDGMDDLVLYPKITYDRVKELLKRTIEVCGDKENSKYSSHYEDFIEELMERIDMTEEEYYELFEED